MLNFIFGRACTGKTHTILERAANESSTRPVVLIVPEQFTFETERAIIRFPNAVSDNVKVLSFTRLFNELAELYGAGKAPYITDFEKVIFTDKALKASVDQLQVFGRLLKYSDFTKQVVTLIQDFKFAGKSADEILSAADAIGGSCGGKLRDLAVIMSAYESLISEKFIDPADCLTRLYELLIDVKYFEGKSVFFDSFTGFTGQQYKIIERILEQARDVTFAFNTSDPDKTDIGVFYNINNAIKKIKSLAASRAVKVASPTVLTESFYHTAALKRLESVLSDAKEKFASPDSEGIRLIRCGNQREEAAAAAQIIRQEVRAGGYRYRDFILVARNADSYKRFVDGQCAKNEVACFSDKSVPLRDTPPAVHINALFDTVLSFTSENILRFLKSGLQDLTEDEIFALENYVYIWDIKGSDWAVEWNMNPRGLEPDSGMTDEDRTTLEQLNRLRSGVYRRLNDFRTRFHGTPTDLGKVLFDFLEKGDCQKLLSALCDASEKEGDHYLASIVRQSWDDIMCILDSLVRVLDDRGIEQSEYIAAFRLATDSMKIANIPQMLDEVTFGSADRIRPSKPKIAVILGANQGVFPNVAVKKGLLAESDRQRLKEYDIFLNDDVVKGAVEEDFLVYSMLCCATDKVYVLYSDTTMSGTGLEPSAFVSRMTENFGDLTPEVFRYSATGAFRPQTARSAFGEIGGMRGDEYETVKRSLQGYDAYRDRLQFNENILKEADFSVSPDTVNALFGDNISISATKFDQFHACRLLYFLRYGLKTGRIARADLSAMQRGTITHYVLENLVKKYHKALGEISNEQISVEIDGLLKDYFDAIQGSEHLMTPRFLFLLSRVATSIKEVAYHMAEEFRQTDFEPAYCELIIDRDGDIPQVSLPIDGGSVFLNGKIDRVDLFQNRVRVVDYKTDSKIFDLPDILVGLNMQMLLYLYAVVNSGDMLVSSPRAAGILYVPVKSKLLKEPLAMNGLISDDEEVRLAMEKDNEGLFVPKYAEDSDQYITDDTFPLIFQKIEELMKEMGNAVKAGDFSADPIDGVSSNACHACDYEQICGKRYSKHRKVPSLTPQQVRNILEGSETFAF